MSACRNAAPLAVLLAGGLLACSGKPLSQHRLFAQPAGAPVHRLVRVDGVVDHATRQALAARGVSLLLRRGEGWWLARGAPRAFDGLVGHHDVIGLHEPAAAEKLSPRLRRLLRSGDGAAVDLWVLLSTTTEGEQQALAALELHALDSRVSRVGFAPLYHLRCTVAAVLEVAGLDVVRYVDLPPGPAVPLLDQSRQAIGVEGLHALDSSSSPPTYTLAGQGTVGAIWDPHGVEPTHGDLKDNLLRFPDPSIPPSLSHGTAVGGCMAGTGARSSAPPDHPWKPYQLRGIAPRAGLAMYVTTGDQNDQGQPTTFLEQYLEARNTYKADVLSFSFSHTGHATYDSAAANLDQVIHGGGGLPEPAPIAVASGNEAWAYGYGSVTSLASAKNVLSVGASDWANGAVVGFSSFGPTADGRLKPEVTAPGCASHGKTKVGVDSVRLIPVQGSPVEWTFDADAEGWSVVRDLDPLQVSGGELQSITTGDNPGLQSPDNLGLDTAQYNRLEVTMRVSRHHRAELYWKTDKGDFQSARRRRFFVNADGKPHTYSIDLADHPQWKDTLERIRIDPITTGIALPAPGDTYTTSCGTSMSTPIAAGGILLLVQAWRETLVGSRPSPAMIKALLVATARDMVGSGQGSPAPYPAGPDYPTGFGEIQIDRAVSLIQQAGKGVRGFVESDIPYTGRRVNVRLRLSQAMSGPLGVTLAWDDPAGEPGSVAVLQNDLDLTVTTPGQQVLLPLVIDPQAPTQPAAAGVDRVNNLEQVRIVDPVAGDYVVTVSGHELAQGPQRFALALSDVVALGGLTLDADGDGAFADVDCDDSDYTVNPAALEIAWNGRDDDCDPTTADQPAPDAGLRDAGPVDADGDGAELRPGGGGCSMGAPGETTGLLWLLLLGMLWVNRRSREVGGAG